MESDITEEISKSPIESLNEQEKLIYEALMIGIKDFYNPQAVRVLEIKKSGDDKCDITITGSNKLGGTIQKYYSLRLVDNGINKKGEMTDWTDFKELLKYGKKYDNVDVGNINRAIKQYWEDLGID